MQIVFKDGQFKTERKGFVQYDYGQEIKISGLDYDADKLVFQFIKNGHQVDTLGVKDENNDFVVAVPNQFLEDAGDILVYCFYETELVGQTEKCIVLDVLSREMYGPEDPEEYHDIIAQILAKLEELQYEIDHFELTPEQLKYIVQQVEAAIDLTDYYDKEEINTLLADKADKTDIPDVSGLATKTEVSEGLATKADKTDTYTKQEVNNLIPDVSGFATKTELSNGLADKADKSDTYTKQEVNNLIPDVSGFATTTQLSDGLALKANAADVYTKSEVYNKTEIDATLGNILTLLEAI